MAYDKKFREQVIKYHEKGNSIKKTSEEFDVGTTTIKEWKKLKKESGSLEKRPLNRTFKKIDPIELKKYIAENPDSFLKEIAKHFKCKPSSVFIALKRLGITRKKNDNLS